MPMLGSPADNLAAVSLIRAAIVDDPDSGRAAIGPRVQHGTDAGDPRYLRGRVRGRFGGNRMTAARNFDRFAAVPGHDEIVAMAPAVTYSCLVKDTSIG